MGETSGNKVKKKKKTEKNEQKNKLYRMASNVNFIKINVYRYASDETGDAKYADGSPYIVQRSEIASIILSELFCGLLCYYAKYNMVIMPMCSRLNLLLNQTIMNI